jgi:two-component system response regulator HydG
MVVVNCAAIPEGLADSELFGHVKGSFSGAVSSHRGLVRAADGGTLFLDDVGTLSLDIQAKLLRVLQQKAVRPVGSSSEVRVDFRVVASASCDLRALVLDRRFREDLYFRLAVLELRMPPLRERGRDLLLLAEHFLEEGAIKAKKEVRGITPAALRALCAHPWPGNVRELKNAIEYAIAVARYDLLQENDLPDSIRSSLTADLPPDEDPSWEAAARRHIEAVLRSVNGNRAQAARLLGIDRKTLHRKLTRMKIDVPPRTKSGTQSAARADSSAQSTRYRFIFR